MSRLKLLVISNYSGINSSRPEAELMLGLKKAGVDITIMTPGTADYVPIFEDAGSRMIDFQPQKKFNKKEIAFIRKELIDGAYDIVHLFNGKAIVNGLQAAWGLKVKVVLYRGYCGNIHWWDPTAYLKYLHPRADAVWCIAPAVADLINRNKIFGKKNAFCITKGHHPDWYSNVEKISFNEFKIPAEAFVVTMVANARPMKGLKYFIEATYSIDYDIPLYILLIGNGLESTEIKKICERSPMKERIIFTGYRSDSMGMVKSSDVFVLSSIYGEAICKSVIEAMSLGVAPVITDIPGNRGMVVNGESGLIVPRKNSNAIARAIEYMFHHPDERKRMATSAKMRMQSHYHIDRTIEEMLSFYLKLTGQ
jgi:L-malate glycosyltransferase